MREFVTYTEAEQKAIDLGAVRVGIYRPKKNGQIFAAHFFDETGLEIGYYIYDLNLPLMELLPRREWSSEILATLEFSEVTE